MNLWNRHRLGSLGFMSRFSTLCPLCRLAALCTQDPDCDCGCIDSLSIAFGPALASAGQSRISHFERIPPLAECPGPRQRWRHPTGTKHRRSQAASNECGFRDKTRENAAVQQPRLRILARDWDRGKTNEDFGFGRPWPGTAAAGTRPVPAWPESLARHRRHASYAATPLSAPLSAPAPPGPWRLMGRRRPCEDTRHITPQHHSEVAPSARWPRPEGRAKQLHCAALCSCVRALLGPGPGPRCEGQRRVALVRIRDFRRDLCLTESHSGVHTKQQAQDTVGHWRKGRSCSLALPKHPEEGTSQRNLPQRCRHPFKKTWSRTLAWSS